MDKPQVQPPTGWEYSGILIDFTRSELEERTGMSPISDEQVATELRVIHEAIGAVMDSRATLGRAVFEQQAAVRNMALTEFMRARAMEPCKE